MKCEQYLNRIEGLIEGELDERSAAAVKLHVFACAECALRYKAAKREREIYARYLFDTEPPVDSWARFQSRLESENEITFHSAEPPAAVLSGWKTNLLSRWRVSPAFAGAILVAVFGIGYGLSKIMPGGTAVDNKAIAVVNSGDIELPVNPDRNVKDESTGSLTKIESSKKTDSPTVIKTKIESNKADGNQQAEKKLKLVAIKAVNKSKSTVSDNKKNDKKNAAESIEDEIGNWRRNLESETARQIEKIELLLRSFRNARSAEESGRFDVAYEKLQARKLLEKNVQLRQGAESYGTFYAEEILGRVEPYLLDISNLENNSPPEKVQEIKERVKNQNIIASLQGY